MKVFLKSCLVGICVLISSCGDSKYKTGKDYLGVLEELSKILEGVNDGDDPGKAVKEINNLESDIDEIHARSTKLDANDPSDTGSDSKIEKLAKEISEVHQKILKELEKPSVADAPEVIKAAKEILYSGSVVVFPNAPGH